MKKTGRPIGTKIGQGKKPCLITMRISLMHRKLLDTLCKKTAASRGDIVEQLIDYYLTQNGVLIEEIIAGADLCQSESNAAE